MLYYKSVYKRHGFFWNIELKQFVQEYGGKKIEYKHPKSGLILYANFCFPEIIRGTEIPGRNFDYYVSAAKYLGEDVVLVGNCAQDQIELLLTETGKFIGFDEYTLIRWGTDDFGWRSGVRNLLNGVAATEIGTIK